MSHALLYGLAGVSVALFSNAARKLPLMRQPWEHVVYFGIGSYLGSQIEGAKETKRQQIAEVRAERAKIAEEREARIAARRAAGEL